RSDALLAGDIDLAGMAVAERAALRLRFREVHVPQHGTCAVSGQPLCAGKPDAARTARDHRCLAAQRLACHAFSPCCGADMLYSLIAILTAGAKARRSRL